MIATPQPMDDIAPAASSPREEAGRAAARRVRLRGFRLLWITSVLIPLLAFAGAAGFSWQEVQAEARERLLRTVDMLHEHALRAFELQEAIMDAVEEHVAGMSWEEIAASREVHAFLRRLDMSAPSANAVGLVAPDGRFAAFSRSGFPTPRIDISDRDYLAPALRGEPGTTISEVVVARPTGAQVFILSRARIDPEGRPDGGVITAAFSPRHFAEFYASITEDPRDVVVLARDDGAILARHPPMPERAQWRVFPGNAVMEALRRSPEGRGVLRSAAGFGPGEERLFAFRRVEDHPVLVAYGLSVAVPRAAWMRQLVPPGIGAAAAAALLLWLTRRAQAEARRGQAEAEAERRAAAERARAEAEARLRHAERANALGQLAAGVAHDFGNTVQAVASGVRLIEAHAHEPERVERYAALIAEAAARGGLLTRRMRDFARRGSTVGGGEGARTADVAAMLAETCDLLDRTLGSRFRIRREVAPDLPRATGVDRADLEAVVVNLAVNARDAMPSGGEITVAARLEEAPPTGPAAPDPPPGRRIRISVADTGIGMDAATLARAGEAFFTTKGPRGTGLGLSMARGFAEHAGGRLLIESEPGRGTTVTLWLPAEAPGAPPQAEP